MLETVGSICVYLACGVTDMRKSIDGLAAIVTHSFELDPFDYLTYLFETLPNIDTTDQRAVARLLPWSEDLPQECRVRNRGAPG